MLYSITTSFPPEEASMRSKLYLTVSLLLLWLPSVFAADRPRTWQAGTLVETEKQQVRQGTTKTSNSEVTAKDKNGKTQYSGRNTSTETENYDTFQVYTIEAEGTTYVAREKLLFPWSKPATVNVGSRVQFAVEKNTLYLLGDDGKQHKAGISKASMNPAR
jgi:hypothetical protein